MACGSGCCGPPKADAAKGSHATPSSPASDTAPQPSITSEPVDKADELVQDSCCDLSSDAAANRECRVPSAINLSAREDDSHAILCSPTTAVGADATQESGCCDPELPLDSSKKATNDVCVAGCCSESPKKEDKDGAEQDPHCCAGKPSPCCDVSCIDRIAMRECRTRKCSDSSCTDNCGPTSSSGPGMKPCSEHTRSAYARYQTQLEALGCICRALLALGQESCCAPQRRPSSKRSMYRSSSASTASLNSNRSNRSSAKKCGRVKNATLAAKSCSKGCCGEAKPIPPSVKACSKGCCDKPKASRPSVKGDCLDECCGATKAAPPLVKDNCAKGCCGEPKPAAPPEKKGCSKGCCGEAKPTPPNDKTCTTGCCDKPKASHPSVKGDCLDECCGTTKAAPPPVKDNCAKGCCGEPKPAAPPEKNGCSKGCCDKPPVSNAVECVDECRDDNVSPLVGKETIQLSNYAIDSLDPEKSGVSGQEHVILSISGMTCTGCETKLQRTLANLSSVTQLKTSLVLARAEFNVDISVSSPAYVIKHLERTTEFKCERVTNQGSSLDLICPNDPNDYVNGEWPAGVTEVKAVNRKTIRVDFDGKIIGARDLTASEWASPMKLAPPQPDRTLEAGSRHVRSVGYMTLLSAILTIPVLVLAWAPLPDKELAYSSASLALATIIQVVIAGPFYPKALKAMVFSRVIEMDLLIVLSTSAAYTFSVISFAYLAAGKPLSTGQFFETSTLLITLIMVGRYVAALARQKAVESISFRSLQTSTATIVDKSGNDVEIDARLLQYGDVFKVAPDTRVPTDGTVVSGTSEIDESMMTGESVPVEKSPGSAVVAGSINGPGSLTVRLTRLPSENTISTIAGMVDEAKLSKPKIQEIADRVATFFVPTVMVLTAITFVIWIAVGMAVRVQTGSEATVQAVTYAITVLIVSCPCAIGLAVPMVIVIATGVAAEHGVIFKSADSIELAFKTSHVVFDKTGTLTQGRLRVTRQEYLTNDAQNAKALLLGLVENIKHPVSRAIAEHLTEESVSPSSSVVDPRAIAGKGVEGIADNRVLRAGNSRWLGLVEDPFVQEIQANGHTAFCFAIDSTPVAIFGLADTVRSDALLTVSRLQDSNVTVHILSGDDDGAVRAVASELGIPNTFVCSRCTPAEKQTYIKDLLTESPTNGGKKSKAPVVVFCGDGTNDAAALAQATIGVHVNEGTDIAKSAADVVLMHPNLEGIITTINISKNSFHRIVFNFGWSFVYNLFAVLLASGAFVNARIPPAYAGLGELVSVLPVIIAALLLRWAKI